MNDAIQAAAFGGEIYLFGVADEASQSVNLRRLQRKNLTLRSAITVDRRRMLGAADATWPRIRNWRPATSRMFCTRSRSRRPTGGL